MKALVWLAALAAVGGGIWWFAAGRSNLPEVKFVQPHRERLISNLTTNAKVEPIEWAPVRAEAAGLVSKVYVKLGDTVAASAPIAQISNAGLGDQLKAAEARAAQAQADLDLLSKGGKSSELAEIASNLDRARFERQNEEKEANSLKRLYDKQAATMVEVETAKAKLKATDLEIEALEHRKASLVSQDDLAAARARVAEAKAAQAGISSRLGAAIVRAPLAGVVYNLPARLGAYLNAGDPVASVGRIGQLRIRVYVDEPELGRVAAGQLVKITWDGLPGKEWQGRVDRLPNEIVPLGTRQVGEVLCTIENPGKELAPGANVNAAIQTSLIEDALTIPKEALHLDNGQATVYTVESGAIRVRAVQHGSDSVTRSQIKDGLKTEDWVALPSDLVLKDGLKVKPVLEK